MASRTHIIKGNGQAAPTSPPPVEYDFKVLNVIRVLTEKHGAGKPSVDPVQLKGMMDLVKHRPMEQVSLTNEQGEPELSVVDYTRGVVRDQDLLDNTRPERLAEILEARTPGQPHDMGLINRLAHKIAAFHALRLSLGKGLKLTPETESAWSAEEGRLSDILHRMDQFEELIEDMFSSQTPTNEEE